MENTIDRVIDAYGGLAGLARALGHRNSSTVQGWRNRGRVPITKIRDVIALAKAKGLEFTPGDFVPESSPPANDSQEVRAS